MPSPLKPRQTSPNFAKPPIQGPPEQEQILTHKGKQPTQRCLYNIRTAFVRFDACWLNKVSKGNDPTFLTIVLRPRMPLSQRSQYRSISWLKCSYSTFKRGKKCKAGEHICVTGVLHNRRLLLGHPHRTRTGSDRACGAGRRPPSPLDSSRGSGRARTAPVGRVAGPIAYISI